MRDAHNGGMTDASDNWGIDELDGLTTTLITHRILGWEVMVGGGDEVFMVTASSDGGNRVANALTTAAPDDDDDDTVELTVGGQAIEVPREYGLTRAETLRALEDLRADTLPPERWEIVGA